ncbi:MAG: hypothetical protein AMJ46_09880 [Latescibacteria bacterium DG_63]|nr:MAG: hypothetical protein AMJ46_09880 [Latescibacteria bacterium DG_63]
MGQKENEQVNFEHQGAHHLARVSLDSESKRVSAGVITNFSDHSAAALEVVDGNVHGTIVHSGNTHSLRLEVRDDGTFSGTYSDTRYGGIEITFASGVATLTKGTLPPGRISAEGDHHPIDVGLDEAGKLNGVVESRALDNATFRIKLDRGRPTGSLVHVGGQHQTEISLSPDGWKGSVSIGKGSSKFTVSVEKGRGETRAFAGLKLNF